MRDETRSGTVFVSVEGEGSAELNELAERASLWRGWLLGRLKQLGVVITHPKMGEALRFASMELALVAGAKRKEAVLDFTAATILRHANPSDLSGDQLAVLFDRAEADGTSEEKLTGLAVRIREIFNSRGTRGR